MTPMSDPPHHPADPPPAARSPHEPPPANSPRSSRSSRSGEPEAPADPPRGEAPARPAADPQPADPQPAGLSSADPAAAEPRSAEPRSAESPAVPAVPAVHRLLDVPGGRIHAVEQGRGPLVLLVHGFPEGWWTWRHQLPALAAAGYRAVALDVRGYGRSSKPAAVEAYGMLAHVSDTVGVVRALGERTAAVVGHDWGATIAANSALLRPDVFTGVAMLGVPYAPRGGPRPTEAFAMMRGGDPSADEFYASWFQHPGRAEAEIEADVRGWLAGFYAALSADTMSREPGGPSPYFVPSGGRMADRFPSHGRLPSWLTEDELDARAAEFERTGLTGALNRYRNMDRDWADLAAWDGAPLTCPSLFVGGGLDASTTWLADAIRAFPTTLPGLRGSHILDTCGHWLPHERPAALTALLLPWLATL